MMTCLHAFSRDWRRLQAFGSSSDWFNVLFASVVIGQSNVQYGLTLLSIMIMVKLTKAPVMLAICWARARVPGLDARGR